MILCVDYRYQNRNLEEEANNERLKDETEKPDELDFLFTRSFSKLMNKYSFSNDKQTISKLSLMRSDERHMNVKSSDVSESEEATADCTNSNDSDYDWTFIMWKIKKLI